MGGATCTAMPIPRGAPKATRPGIPAGSFDVTPEFKAPSGLPIEAWGMYLSSVNRRVKVPNR